MYQHKHFNLRLFEFIEAPRLADLNLSDHAIVAAWSSLSERIAKIEGKLPYYRDISEKKVWKELMETMQGKGELEGELCSFESHETS